MEKNIVYIVIVVIWIVSSIIKAKNKNAKKAAQQPNSQPKDSPAPSGMEEFKKILEEMITGKQQEIPTTQTVEVNQDNNDYSLEKIETADQSKYAAFQGKTEYSFSNYTNLEDIYDFEKEKNEKIAQKDFYNTMQNNADENKHDDESIRFLDEQFDLKKAVIYSEILKRPHF